MEGEIGTKYLLLFSRGIQSRLFFINLIGPCTFKLLKYIQTRVHVQQGFHFFPVIKTSKPQIESWILDDKKFWSLSLRICSFNTFDNKLFHVML